MEDFERRRYFETLATTPQTLKAALKGLSKKVLLWTPAPGKWSILEILCHMRDMEREAYIERYTRILSENEPALPDLDGEALASGDEGDGEREIEGGALLGEVGRGEIDGDAPQRILVLGIEQRAAHAVLALPDRRLGQADDGEARQSVGEVHLHGHRGCVHTDLGARPDDGEAHGVPP